MANLPNFLQAQLSETPFGSAVDDYYAGRKLGAIPGELERQKQMEELRNQILGTQSEFLPREKNVELERNRIKGIKEALEAQNYNKYGAAKENAELTKSLLENAYYPQRQDVEIRGKELENENQWLTNEIKKATGMDQAQADLLAKQILNQKTQTEADLLDQYGAAKEEGELANLFARTQGTEATTEGQRLTNELTRQYGSTDRALDQEQKFAAIQGSQLQNEATKIALKYLPELQQQQVRSGKIGIEQALENLSKTKMDNALTAAYGPQLKQAQLNEAEMRALLGGKPTPETQYAILNGGRPGTKEFNRALAQAKGLGYTDWENVPEGARAFANMTKSQFENIEQNMRQERDRAASAQQFIPKIERAMEIVEAYPNMANDLSLIMANPEDPNIIQRVFAKYGTSKEKLAAAQELQAIASYFNIAEGENLGKNYTDVRTKLIASGKASAKNQSAANLAALKVMKNNFDRYPFYQKELEKGLRHGYEVPTSPENFSGQVAAANASTEELLKMLKGD